MRTHTAVLAFMLLIPRVGTAQPNPLGWKASQFVISVFQCSMVAPDTIEQERLFNMGMKMGQDFIQFAKLNQTEEDKKIMNKEVPLVWALSWPGPSTDFILGRVYQQIFDGLVNRQRSEIPNADKEKAQRWGHWLYQDSNCAMLR